MMTIQNVNRPNVEAKPIYHYRSKCSPDMIVDMEVQTCRDLPNDVGQEMLKEFPFLQCIHYTLQDGEVAVVTGKFPTIISAEEFKEAVVEAPKDFLKELEASNPIICNQCGEHFKSVQGRKTHITTKHK